MEYKKMNNAIAPNPQVSPKPHKNMYEMQEIQPKLDAYK